MPPILRGLESEPDPVQGGTASALATVPSGSLVLHGGPGGTIPLAGGTAAVPSGGGGGGGGVPVTVYRVSWSGAGGGRLAQLHLFRQRRFEAPWAEAEAAAALAVGGSAGAATVQARQVRGPENGEGRGRV
jgi:hypothetical protein